MSGWGARGRRIGTTELGAAHSHTYYTTFTHMNTASTMCMELKDEASISYAVQFQYAQALTHSHTHTHLQSVSSSWSKRRRAGAQALDDRQVAGVGRSSGTFCTGQGRPS